MKNNWYEIVSANKPLTQGDIIFDCPILVWKTEIPKITFKDEVEVLESSIEPVLEDVVVLTQACDLEHNKVPNITLCKHSSISSYKYIWENLMKSKNENPTEKNWRKHFNGLKDGYLWNMSLLNDCNDKKMQFEHRIVDFYEVYTIPRAFLEGILKKRKTPRPRLLPPYREHLSQAFARFYMRVGLPTPINKIS